jgi:hypothetical protein
MDTGYAMETFVTYTASTLQSTDPSFWLMLLCFYYFASTIDTIYETIELKNNETATLTAVRFDVTRDILIEIRNELEKINTINMQMQNRSSKQPKVVLTSSHSISSELD